jgi:hypothetical protein
MSNDEKLKEYLRQNKIKPEPKRVEIRPAVETKGMTTSWFMLRQLPLKVFMLLIYLLAFMVIVGVTLDKFLPGDEGLLYTFAAMAVIGLACAGWWLYQFSQYKKWISGKLYPITGWAELLASRSKVFWKKEFYIPVTVNFKLTSNATGLHHEAIMLFLKNTVSNKRKYSDMDWHAGGHPSDFKVNKKSITGDVDTQALNWLAETLSKNFIPLSKLLGNALESVTMEYEGYEREYRHKYRGRDPHERNDWKNTLNSLND